ncbi:MAG: IS630 family transposase [Maribacter sp.]|nr:IS630 family transposase [Maribacter sp.]
MKFISAIDEKQESGLRELMKNSVNHRIRIRAHSILLSAKGYAIEIIADIFQVARDTVSSWIDRWVQSGINGLSDMPRSGRPPLLTDEERDKLLELIKKYPQSIRTVISRLYEMTGKSVSSKTIRRLAEAAGLIWKRVRKSLKSKRDQEHFEKTEEEIRVLEKQHDNGEADLFYFDESGFTLEPSIPYAWQPVGENIVLPTSKSTRINVLGFLSIDMNFQSYIFKCSVNTDVVEACFDHFSEIITRKTVVIVDNAPTHTSIQFTDNLKKWEEKGLSVKYQPPYSPELNKIETLWKFIKYYQLPFSAYNSIEDLEDKLENILINIGKEYLISFS